MKFTRMITIGSLVLVLSFGLVRPELVAQSSNSSTGSSLKETLPVVTAAVSKADDLAGKEELTTKSYYVYDLVMPLINNGAVLGGVTQADFQPLETLISNTIEPESWGRGGKSIQSHPQNQTLVVRHDERVHEMVGELLKKLRELNRFTIELDSSIVLISKDNKLLPAQIGERGQPIDIAVVREIREAEKKQTLDCLLIPEAELYNGQELVYQNLNQELWSVKGVSVQFVFDQSLKSLRFRLSGLTELPSSVPEIPRSAYGLVACPLFPTAMTVEKPVDNHVRVITIADGKYMALDVSSMLNADRQDRRAILIVNAKIKDNQKPQDN